MSQNPQTDAELQEFAKQFQNNADGGGFNPFALFAGQSHFHAVFLAPFSPAMAAAVTEFLNDGSGPLSGLVQQFIANGLAAAEAANRARQLLSHAHGMLVVVLRNDQGLSTIPQLFFGHLEPAYQQQALDLCGDDFPQRDTLANALTTLASAAEHGAQGCQLYVSADGHPTAQAFWLDLAERLIAGIEEGILPGARDRLRDLAHWSAAGLRASTHNASGLDGNGLMILARCHLIAGEADAAIVAAQSLLSTYEPEDEDLLAFLEQVVASAIDCNNPEQAVTFLDGQQEAIDPILGGCYEIELLRFKALAAAQANGERLLAQAAAMAKADRKSYRHDLNREPLWRVALSDPGPTFAVHEAASFLDRSINFVAKRLESGTIPYIIDGDDRRIPQRALAHWKAIVDEHRLID